MTILDIVSPHAKDQDNFGVDTSTNDNSWDSDFQFVDGLRFDNGDSTLQNEWASLVSENLERSAERGSSLAQSCLSYMYLEGFGVEKDPVKAFHWCSVVATQEGKADAIFELGLMHLQGIGVKKCKSTAIELFNVAGQQDHAQALFKLAELLLEDLGKEKEKVYRRAFHACHRSAELGLVEAQFNLGVMYEDGVGTRQNPAEAAFWYQRAAKNGNKYAMNNLAALYLHGKGVIEDRKKAKTLFCRADDNGSILAQFNLGLIYGLEGNESKKFHSLVFCLSSYSQSVQGAKSFINSCLIKFSIMTSFALASVPVVPSVKNGNHDSLRNTKSD